MSNEVEFMFNELRDRLKEKFEFWCQDIRDEDVMDFCECDLYETIQGCEFFKLFRYMPSNYYNIRNFEKQIIHLSQNGVLNDVYEGMPNLQEELSYFKIKKLSDLAYMTCLTETNNNTLMWSHYANNHEGICVEYDLKLLQTDPYGICKHLFPILYSDVRPSTRNINSLLKSHNELKKAIDENYIYDGDEMLDDILPMFLTKGSEWKYEREWRIIYTKKQMYNVDEEILYSENLPFSCVSAVYLGYRINPDIKTNLIEIADRISTAENRKIQVYQAKLNNTGYEILFDRVN